MSQYNEGVQVNRVPMLNANDFEMWKIIIKQYILVTDYMMWEVIEYGSIYVQTFAEDGSKIKRATPTNDEKRRIR